MTAPSLPPTERLYWSQPQACTFDANVIAVRGHGVALDQTLYYPEGGGQPCDAGTLRWNGSEVAVTDVQKEEGVIWHRLDGPLPGVEQRVTGTLDWGRRFRHSQRHTAEHLLAQAFSRIQPRFAVRSVSMRGPDCTLDLAGEPSEADAEAAQRMLLEAIRSDLTLETALVPAAELNRYPLRRPSQVSGQVRVVLFREAGGTIWEASACGGTHLPRASLAAPVVVTRLERVKGDLTRVTFLAGEEATERLSLVHRQATALARSFGAGLERLPERVQGLRGELTIQTAEAEALRRQVAGLLLKHAEAQPLPGGRFVLLEVEDERLLRPLLDLAAERADGVTVAVCPGGQCGVTSSLPQLAAPTLLRGWLESAGGRGGGRPALAQGQTIRPAVFMQAARQWASEAGSPC